MDLSLFDEKYKNDGTGRLAYDPKVFLKIVLFAYSRGLTGSRRIEQACRENVIFMALPCGQRPDHSTIAAFVSSMKAEIMPLFRDVLLVFEEEDLLGGSFFALDGLKLPANASKQWSGRLSELENKKDRHIIRTRYAPLSPASGFPVCSRSLRSAQSRKRVPSFAVAAGNS